MGFTRELARHVPRYDENGERDNGHRNQQRRDRRAMTQEERAERVAERATVANERALQTPGWVSGYVEADRWRRYADRERAKRAASELGVAVPDWAVLGHHEELTTEHREKIRDAFLRRYSTPGEEER